MDKPAWAEAQPDELEKLVRLVEDLKATHDKWYTSRLWTKLKAVQKKWKPVDEFIYHYRTGERKLF